LGGRETLRRVPVAGNPVMSRKLHKADEKPTGAGLGFIHGKGAEGKQEEPAPRSQKAIMGEEK